VWGAAKGLKGGGGRGGGGRGGGLSKHENVTPGEQKGKSAIKKKILGGLETGNVRARRGE